MFNIHFTLSYLETYLLFINIFSFILYGIDKLKAMQNKKYIQRISEKTLLISSFVGGSLSSIVAMVLFRHKIKKLSFMIKYVLIVIIQVIGVYLYFNKICVNCVLFS